MRREATSVKPLISVASADSAATAQVQIPPFLEMSDWEMTTTNPADSFPVFRTINDQSRWNFYDTQNFLQGDTDYSGTSNPASLNFVFFAVAYGKDPETIGQDLYSLPDSVTVSGNIISYP
jgi:hypothetical protein